MTAKVTKSRELCPGTFGLTTIDWPIGLSPGGWSDRRCVEIPIRLAHLLRLNPVPGGLVRLPVHP